MRFQYGGEVRVAKPPQEVMRVLANPEAAARLIPGLTNLRRDGDEYVGEIPMRLGIITGRVTTRFTYRAEADGVTVAGRATGLQTNADYTLTVKVEPAEGGSLVRWQFTGEARGLAETLSPGLVESVMRRLAEGAAKSLASL